MLVPHIHELMDKFRGLVDFLLIYILEAHAQDEWPISSSRDNCGRIVTYNQHKTIEDRISAAKDFKESFHLQMDVVVDAIDNPFERAYAPWPLRFFILVDNKVQFIAQAEDWLPSLEDAMQQILH